jgi:hypothetical protein
MAKYTMYIGMAFIILQGCTAGGLKIVDDVLEGEGKVVESVISDEAGIPNKQ